MFWGGAPASTQTHPFTWGGLLPPPPTPPTFSVDLRPNPSEGTLCRARKGKRIILSEVIFEANGGTPRNRDLDAYRQVPIPSSPLPLANSTLLRARNPDPTFQAPYQKILDAPFDDMRYLPRQQWWSIAFLKNKRSG